MRALVIAIVLAGCAPQLDGPGEHHRAIDREDGDRLATQLAQLPGAVRAQVTLHRPVRDPLDPSPAFAPLPPGSAAVLVVIDDRADRSAIESAARRLVHGTAPELADPAIVIELGAVRPVLARVGPFVVEERSKPALVVVLATAFALIALLAGSIAWRARRTVAS